MTIIEGGDKIGEDVDPENEDDEWRRCNQVKGMLSNDDDYNFL